MNRFKILMFLCVLFNTALLGQKNKSLELMPDYQKWAIKASYFGEQIVHAGLKLGVEYPFSATKVIVEKKTKGQKKGQNVGSRRELGLLSSQRKS